MSVDKLNEIFKERCETSFQLMVDQKVSDKFIQGIVPIFAEEEAEIVKLFKGEVQAPDPAPIPVPHPSAFPSELTTGPRTTNFTEVGTVTTKYDGEIIEGLIVSGELRVEHNNVRFVNSIINSHGGQAVYNLGNANLYLEDAILDGQGKNAEPAVAFHNYRMLRCEVKNFGEGPRANGNVLIQDNYMHSFANFVSKGAHQDGIQCTGGSNVSIIHNTILVEPDGANGSIFFSTSGGSNIKIHNNLCGGGNWAINLDHNLYSDVEITDNQFTTKIPYHEKGGYFAPITPNRGTNWVVAGNRWHDGPNVGELV